PKVHHAGPLTKVRVQGFKAIVDTKSLELKPLTVFLGRNGSGKSSLLESVQWLQECLRTGIQPATRNRGFEIERLINVRSDRIALELTLNDLCYSLEVGKSSPGEACGVLNERLFTQTPAQEEIFTGQRGRLILGGLSVQARDTLALSRVQDARAKAPAAR